MIDKHEAAGIESIGILKFSKTDKIVRFKRHRISRWRHSRHA